MKKMILLISMILMISSSVFCEAPVDLGTAGNYAILAKSGISTTSGTHIVGDIAVSPAAASYMTGFGLIMDPSGIYSTSSLVTGKIYAADYTSPTPANLTTAISNMETAYTNAAGRPDPDFTELYSGDLTGQTLIPGLYKWGTGVLIGAGGVTISGAADDVWIFQIAGTLTVANGAIVYLGGAAKSENIFWQVAEQTTIGTNAHFEGIILDQTAIVVQTGASVNGRLLAQTAVTLDANSVNEPDLPVPVILSSFTVTYNEFAELHWTTQSETDNLGFNLYRSENQNGFIDDEYLQINSELIPGMGTTFIPSSYNFTDEFLVLGGHSYYYWLQSVSNSGELELYGPISVEIPYEGEIVTVLSDFNVVYENSHPVLSWTTASETDNLGYFVQRSEDLNGYVLDDCVQLNNEIITGMGTTSYDTDYTFIDNNFVIEGHTYYYWLESLSPVGDVNVFGPVSLEIPDLGGLPNAIFETSLNPNYPNPFNPETTISFNIKENEIGVLTIFNLRGQCILKERFETGRHQYYWNAEGLASGIYFYKLSSPTTNMAKKMILMK